MFYQQISHLIPYDYLVIVDWYGPLLLNVKASLSQFVGKCILVDFLEESVPERISDSIGRTDNGLGQFFQIQTNTSVITIRITLAAFTVWICVHPRRRGSRRISGGLHDAPG